MRVSADIDELCKVPGAYEAFQAVRLLERHLWSKPLGTSQRYGQVTTSSGLAHHRGVLFHTQASLAFPASEITSITPLLSEENSEETQWIVEISFFGLTGPQGVLPLHISALLLGDGNSSRPALKDLLDLMDHRLISHFMLAWERSRPIACLERATRQSNPADEDAYTTSFRALVNGDQRKSQSRLAISPNLPIFFAGLFSDSVRSAIGLQQILSHALGLAVHVEEFVGEWLEIPLDKQSRLNCDSHESSRIDMFCLGAATWSIQDRFRIELGPVDYATFLRLTPGGDLYAAVIEIARLYAGCQFMIEIMPLLAAKEVPPCELNSNAGFQLGINVWLTSQPFTEPVRDAIFTHPGANETPEIFGYQ